MAPMDHRTLGGTGWRVSPLALGTMMLGAWGNQDRADCLRIVHRALDAGVNLVDTADVYAFGETEEIVGEALAGSRRDHVILATKAHGPMSDDPNHRGNSRRWLTKACEDSLRRLRTDHIDLFQLHRPDPDTDLDETLGALTDLVRAGKVRAVGTSTFQAEEIVEALWCADARGHVRLRCEQPPYNIFVRGAETAVLPTCRRHGLGVITYSPLNGGWLTGRYRRDKPLEQTTRTEHMPRMYDPSLPLNARRLDLVEALSALAAEAGISLTHLALAFITSNPQVTAAIIGPRTMAHLDDQLAAMELRLPADVLDRIDELVPPGTNIDPSDAGYRTPAETAHWNERVVRRDGVSFGSAR
jgi:aryl-alcohol dehydrogenase-like predicted oxidoreductase